jgi:hypothetical protein
MKYRKDIHDYLISLDKYYSKKDYKIFEQDGFLYRAEYDYDNKNKILYYGSYYDLHFDDKLELLLNSIENKYNLNFAGYGCDIICRCGTSNKFSAHIAGYVILKCNNCGHEFKIN